MPYVICSRCELTTYSAALWSSTDECPHCGALLPSGDRAAMVSLARQAGLLDRSSHAGATGGGGGGVPSEA